VYFLQEENAQLPEMSEEEEWRMTSATRMKVEKVAVKCKIWNSKRTKTKKETKGMRDALDVRPEYNTKLSLCINQILQAFLQRVLIPEVANIFHVISSPTISRTNVVSAVVCCSSDCASH
jgi:hypothetical protein